MELIPGKCETCRVTLHTWELAYTQCGETRWPYLAKKPTSYVCQRCVSGAGAAKRESGRKGANARVARRKQERGPNG